MQIMKNRLHPRRDDPSPFKKVKTEVSNSFPASKAQPPPKKRRVPAASTAKAANDGATAPKRGRPKAAGGEKNGKDKEETAGEGKKERAKRKKHRVHYGMEPMSTTELILEALSSLPDENGGVSVSAIKSHVLLNGDLAPGRIKFLLRKGLKKLVERGQ